ITKRLGLGGLQKRRPFIVVGYPGEFVVVRDKRTVTSAAEAFAGSVASAADRIVVANALLKQEVKKETNSSNTLLKGRIGEAGGIYERLRSVGERCRAITQVTKVCSDMGFGCGWRREGMVSAEGQKIFEGMTVGVDGVGRQAQKRL